MKNNLLNNLIRKSISSSREKEVEVYNEMMREYRAFAKYITQMATASLVLPIFFIRDIIGIEEGVTLLDRFNLFLIISWIMLFISIGCGIWYQYVSTKKIIEGRGKRIRRPELFFGLMLGGFYVGIGLFMIGVIKALY